MFFFFNFSVIKNVLNYLHINDDVREKSIRRFHLFSNVLRKMHPGKSDPRKNAPGKSAHRKTAPRKFTPQEKQPQKIVPRKIAPSHVPYGRIPLLWNILTVKISLILIFVSFNFRGL